MQKIKCHTCGRDAKLISEYVDDIRGLTYKFQCGKGHVSILRELERTV